MGNAFRLGRVFGIELRVDPSWIFIFLLVGWSLTALFGTWHPDWSPWLRLVVALSAALMFFASVLVHELAHALVAMQYGIPVRDITLHLFGGVSNIEEEPPTPMAEFLIAVVGPLVSIGLGVGIFALTTILINLRGFDPESPEMMLAGLGPIETLLTWLGPVNVIVGLFNLIPGFPLDGGRVLRAIVWRVTGDLRRATRIASGAGQAVGWFFVMLGLFMVLGYRVPVFGSGLIGGLWLAMIGLFLRNVAMLHLRGSEIEAVLADVPVRELMRTSGAVVTPDMTVRTLVDDWFLRHDEAAYPVMDRGALVGLVSIDDLPKTPADAWGNRLVRDVMTPTDRLVVVRPTDELSKALRKLARLDVRQVPVLEGDGLVGMLYERDVARWIDLRRQMERDRRPWAPQPA